MPGDLLICYGISDGEMVVIRCYRYGDPKTRKKEASAMNELTRADVVAAIERRSPSRVPMHNMHYYNAMTAEKYKPQIARLHEKYPDDVVNHWFGGPNWEALASGAIDDGSGLDKRVIISEYTRIAETAERIRVFGRDIDRTGAAQRRKNNPDRYCLGYTWFTLFERLWMLRGMENALMDFYENPEDVRTLLRAICDFHLHAIRAYGEMGYDGVSMSDDLGTQISTMFSRDIFVEFFKPLYRELFGVAHEYGMHTWLHSCGCVQSLLGDLIDAGLDVIHPIQYSTFPGGVSANDPREIVRTFGGKITFWAGIDVQYLLPLGTEQQVRAGVRELIDLFDGPDGGLVIASGNGIMPETPVGNIEAFFDEAYRYGRIKRAGGH